MKTPRLQYKLSNGNWVDCRERDEEFFNHVVENNPKFSREQIVKMLADGKELRNHPADWYSYCRDKIVAERTETAAAERRRAAYAATTKTPAPLSGQLWEECPRCGQSPVYMSAGGVCADCARK